jgi:hypothetical protein
MEMRLEAEGRPRPHALAGSIAAAPAPLIKSRRENELSEAESVARFFIVVSDFFLLRVSRNLQHDQTAASMSVGIVAHPRWLPGSARTSGVEPYEFVEKLSLDEG